MDATDRALLALVQQNGKWSYAELGEQVGLSISAVNERLRKLQGRGVIRRYAALLDAGALGLDVCAFVQVQVDGPLHEARFLAFVQAAAEVQECHHITGAFSYLVKVRVASTARLEAFLRDLKAAGGEARTHSFIALSTPKETPALPVGTQGIPKSEI